MPLSVTAITPRFPYHFSQTLVAWICLLWLTACSTIPDPALIPLTDTPNTIYFIYRDWHTSVMIDGEDFRRYSTLARADGLGPEVANARYVRVGWGDGDYFTGRSTTIATATRALFISNYSAMQFLGYEGDPFEYIPSETRVPLAIGDQALAALVHYMDASLARDESGRTQQLPAYIENSGVFLRSSKRYGLFNNCNSWSSEALQSAGLPIRGALNLTAQSVFEQARAISDYQRQHRATE